MRRLRLIIEARQCIAFILAAVILLSWSTTAGAQSQSSQSLRGPAYKLELELDLPIVLVSGAVASAFFFVDESPGVACAPSCDRSRINGLDRPAAGLYDRRWSAVGDIATASTIALPLGLVILHEGLVDGLNDDLVIAEATLVSSALQVVTGFAVARPRPRVYGDDAPIEDRTDANAARSFFSGHTADTVATSTAALRTFQRLGKPTLGWTVFGITMAGSTLVGVARVASGAHFPTDVIVGAAAGFGVGLALPALHSSGARLVPTAGTDGGGLSIAGLIP